MLFPQGHFVFLDLETTGGKASQDRITEVGLIEVLDGEVVDQYQSLVNPGVPISSFITSLTGIDDQLVADAPAFSDIAEDLLSHLHGRTLVAHNARFDHGFLKNEFKRLGYDYRTKVMCTVKLSRLVTPDLNKHSLDNLIHVHGLHVDARHRAMGDADLLVQLVARWSRLLGVEAVQTAIQQLTRRSSMPPNLPLDEVDKLPNCPGVYKFYDNRDALLYVGKSVSIRDRVKSHFSADHASDKEMELSRQVVRIEYVETAGDLGAQLLEANLIKTQSPIYNRQLRRNKKLWYMLLEQDGNGYLRVAIKSGDSLPLESLDKTVGLFRSKKMTEQTLRKVAEDNSLCHRLTGLEKSRKGACFAHQLKRCHGACVGKEEAADYNQRLLSGLDDWRVKVWPYAGPVVIKEMSAQLTNFHLIDQWCYLGSAESIESLPDQKSTTPFEYDLYKIVLKFFDKADKNPNYQLIML
ncbi:exonuclease domain-containing protein [Aurantivibrio plasticivorans]